MNGLKYLNNIGDSSESFTIKIFLPERINGSGCQGQTAPLLGFFRFDRNKTGGRTRKRRSSAQIPGNMSDQNTKDVEEKLYSEILRSVFF